MRAELEDGTIDVNSGVVNTRIRPQDSEEDDEEDWLQEFDKHAKEDDAFLSKYEHDLAKIKEREAKEQEADASAKEVNRVELLREVAEILNWGVRLSFISRFASYPSRKPSATP